MSISTLYLDAAGDPGWPPPFGKSKINWYVLAGICLSPQSDLQVRSEIERLLKKYVTPTERAKWPPTAYEISYHNIQRGKIIFEHLEHAQRKALSDEVFNLITAASPVLFATAINNTKLKQKYGQNAYSPRSLAIRATIHRFSMYLKKNNLIGSVVVDEEEYRKDKELQKMVHDFRRTGIILRGWSYQPAYEDKLDRILNTITFAPSQTSPGIQLADVCSRATWSHYERNKSNRFNQLSNFWNEIGGTKYEPSIIPQ